MEDDSDEEPEDDLERLTMESNARRGVTNSGNVPSNETSVSGVNRLDTSSQGGRYTLLGKETEDMVLKTMTMVQTLANTAQEGSKTQATLNDALAVLVEGHKRKREEGEPEEDKVVLKTETVVLRDDSTTVVDMKIRQKLKNPNMDPSSWWTVDCGLEHVSRPVVANLHLSHLMSGRVNQKTIKRLHDRTRLVTTKALASHNCGALGEREMKYKMQATDDDETYLVGSRNYVDCKTCWEVIDSIWNLVDVLHIIRPFSYEAIALLRCLHHVRYYYGVAGDPKTQKTLCEKLISEVLSYNQRRGLEKKHPATFKKCLELGREVAVASGISQDLLIVKADPYAGRKDPVPGSSEKKIQDLERELQKAKNQASNSNQSNRGNYSSRGRGYKSSRGGYNNNRPNQPAGYNSHGFGNQGFAQPAGISAPVSGSQDGNQSSQAAITDLTKQKLQQTCSAYNMGLSCDGSCGQLHVCNNVIRPGRLCWQSHPACEHK